MWRNYFKITWRNLAKDRQFSLLNLAGLSTGIACVILIYLWIADERSIDRFNEKDSQLFQVIKTSLNVDGTIETHETTPGLLAQAMVQAIPEVEYAVPVSTEPAGLLSADEKYIKARPQFAGRDFLNVFSYKLIDGNKNKALSDKHGVILSDKLALKLFNTTSGLVGKTLIWDGIDEMDGPYTISGIIKGPPANASAQFDIVFSYDLY